MDEQFKLGHYQKKGSGSICGRASPTAVRPEEHCSSIAE